MSANGSPRRRSALLSFTFVGTAFVGSLTMVLVCLFAPLAVQLAALGVLLSVLGGLLLSHLGRMKQDDARHYATLEQLAIPLTFAPEHEFYTQYVAICQALTNVMNHHDPIFREIALLKLASVESQIGQLAESTIIFTGAETWGRVYEKLLTHRAVKEHQSVMRVRGNEFWQDEAGRQSMQANFEAVYAGTLIERVIILRDDLWPQGQPLPTEAILPWIEQQHNHGLRISVIRESEVTAEPDLLADFGIFGTCAWAAWELDDRGRVLAVSLHFDAQTLQQAKERWQRLERRATPLRKMLDQSEGRG
jgi:hypothetical protein